LNAVRFPVTETDPVRKHFSDYSSTKPVLLKLKLQELTENSTPFSSVLFVGMVVPY